MTIRQHLLAMKYNYLSHIRILILSFFLLALVSFSSAQRQNLSPNFDAVECEEVLKLNKSFLDTNLDSRFEDMVAGYQIHYRTPSVGLDNRADIWLRADSTVVIMLRGTTRNPSSLLADFYCAMLPANGRIQLNGGREFNYQLASDERAAVHAGFLIGFAYLADHLEERISTLYHNGYRQFLVGGHSQGGALCYYFSAWLMQKRKQGIWQNTTIKTYASASPKVGNMYFAYDYDNAHLAQWSFSLVNTADAVPEIPLTTQQLEIDMNEPNPMIDLYERMNGLPFFKRTILKRSFNVMDKRARKSSEAYQKYLGKYVGRFIKNHLPELELPQTVKTTYFVRPGVPIILSANDSYLGFYKDASKYFHHGIDSYRFLLREYFHGLDEFAPFVKR